MFPQQRWPLVREHNQLPYYVQAVIWCWHKPIWMGLPPFVPFVLVCLLADFLTASTLGIVWLLKHWGR